MRWTCPNGQAILAANGTPKVSADGGWTTGYRAGAKTAASRPTCERKNSQRCRIRSGVPFSSLICSFFAADPREPVSLHWPRSAAGRFRSPAKRPEATPPSFPPLDDTPKSKSAVGAARSRFVAESPEHRGVCGSHLSTPILNAIQISVHLRAKQPRHSSSNASLWESQSRPTTEGRLCLV